MHRTSESVVSNKIKYASISAVVTRADGTVEDLGIICDTSFKSKLKSFFRNFFVKGNKNGIEVYNTSQ